MNNNEAPPSHDVRNAPQIASADFVYDSLILGAATFINRRLTIGVPKGLTRRRIFASFVSQLDITFVMPSIQAFSGSLNCLLAGTLVYRMPFGRHVSTLPGYSASTVSVRPACSEAQSDSAGATYPGFQDACSDSLIATIGTVEHVCPPWRLNLTCDQIVLQLDDVVLGYNGAFVLGCHSEGECDA